MLSPTEALGLSGTALEGRIRRAAHHVPDAVFARLAEQLNTDAFASGMIYERDDKPEAVRIMLRPLLAMNEQLSYVHYVCLQVNDALKCIPGLYLENENVRNIMRIAPEEERWIREMWSREHHRTNPVYGRLDAVCDFSAAQWQDTLHFMEPNLSGVGGIHYGPIAERLVMKHIMPTLLAHDPDLEVEFPRDQRELFVQLLIDHARAIGRAGCNLCMVEPKYEMGGPAEQSVLCNFIAERHKLVACHADPRELYIKDGDVFYENSRVDVAYRDYETRDLIALEEELGKPLDGMRMLFKQNRVISSIVGDLDHKSGFEVLTDPNLAEKFFSGEECRLFRRHVLWTRLVAERKTSLPDGAEGDLLEYARKHRENLVLKPNRGYGGEGVQLGADASDSEWEILLNEAATKGEDPDESWVLQHATQLPVTEFPVVSPEGRVFDEPFYVVMGFAATENGLGTMCRVSQKHVVNVAQHGGMAAVLIARQPDDLRIPKRSIGRAEAAAETLRAQVAEIRHLDNIIALLEWDEETMVPPEARDERGEQLATLEGLRHNLLISDRMGDLIETVAVQCENDPRWQREIALLRDERDYALAMPEDLVREFAVATSAALASWEEAREDGGFAHFAKDFENVVRLTRESAQALAGNGELYDALLDENEPGMTRARLEPALNELRTWLVPMVREAHELTKSSSPLVGRTFPAVGQWELSRRILGAIGFDFERGRLDKSTHPFTEYAGRDDVRLTARVREHDLGALIFSTLHEGGHGLYDQGFASEDRDWMLGDAPSMGMHEGQARLWENHVGRSAAFWQYIYPKLRELFPQATHGFDANSFHRAVNVVKPSVTRTTADEMSYHLHIVMRYELEIALLSGDLAVHDLPEAWNEKSKALIGVVPASDKEGVLQDVHWAEGMFGYFPAYTIGSLYAAQLVETYSKSHPLEDEIRRGHFAGLLGWLRENVHRHGAMWTSEQLMTSATGKGLDAGAFFRHCDGVVRSLKG